MDGGSSAPILSPRPLRAVRVQISAIMDHADRPSGLERTSRAASERCRFGEIIRQKRLAKGLSLRRFAQLVGVSPTYISQVEQGHFDPPTAERAERMAVILGESADALIALAGRLPHDLSGIICERPLELAAFLRESSGLTREQLQSLVDHARRLRESNRSGQP